MRGQQLRGGVSGRYGPVGLDPEDVVGVFRAAADSLVGADEFEVQPCEGVSAALVIGGVSGRSVRH